MSARDYPWWWEDAETLAKICEVVKHFADEGWVISGTWTHSQSCFMNEQLLAIREGLVD